MDIIQNTAFDQLNDAGVLKHIPGVGMVGEGSSSYALYLARELVVGESVEPKRNDILTQFPEN